MAREKKAKRDAKSEAKPKAEQPRKISENPGAKMALVNRARRGR